jgi:hypothetical protein
LKLPLAYLHLLCRLHEVGSATLDRYGRLCTSKGSEPQVLPGDAVAWLYLVAWGYAEAGVDMLGFPTGALTTTIAGKMAVAECNARNNKEPVS